jgi:hypothetical protein
MKVCLGSEGIPPHILTLALEARKWLTSHFDHFAPPPPPVPIEQQSWWAPHPPAHQFVTLLTRLYDAQL